jgi:hypothetical protein
MILRDTERRISMHAVMMMPLERGKRTWAAFCDRCLIGSFPFTHDDTRIARRFAVEKLRALGWTHEVPSGLPPGGRDAAEGAWTGETFCFECSAARRAMTRSAG